MPVISRGPDGEEAMSASSSSLSIKHVVGLFISPSNFPLLRFRSSFSLCHHRPFRRAYSWNIKKLCNRTVFQCLASSKAPDEGAEDVKGQDTEVDVEEDEGMRGIFTNDRLDSTIQEVVRRLEKGKEMGKHALEEIKGVGIIESEERERRDFFIDKEEEGNMVKNVTEKATETVVNGLENLRGRFGGDMGSEDGMTRDALHNAARLVVKRLSPAMMEKIGWIVDEKAKLRSAELEKGNELLEGKGKAKDEDEDEDERENRLVEKVSLALESLGVSPAEILGSASKIAEKVMGIDSDIEVESANPPSEPAFDSSTAIALAGYAFRAYHPPPPGCLWEEYSTTVKNSNASQEIATQFAYPAVNFIAERFGGLYTFSVDLEEQKGDDDDTDHNLRDLFVTGTLNGIRQRHVLTRSQVHMLSESTAFNENEDNNTLELKFYESEKVYEGGSTPLARSKLKLSELEMTKGETGSWREIKCSIPILAVSKEDHVENFFSSELLDVVSGSFPDPVRNKIRSIADQTSIFNKREKISAKLMRTKLHVKIEYRDLSSDGSDSPFEQVISEDGEDEVAISGEENAEEKLEEATDFLEGQLNTDLPLPEDWLKLVEAAKSIVKKNPTFLKDFKNPPLGETLEPALYVSSVDTSTEIWFYRNEASKNVVVSFRGTEKVEWRDFLTDALAFAQAWEIGGNIDLVSARSDNEDADADDKVSKVHYGFLRAYHSVRAGLDRALSLLTNNFDPQYHIYFTGHSLGGALATLAIVDNRKRRGPGFLCSAVSFGAPKTGNLHFAREFNKYVHNAFRIVNDSDLVARFPKGQYKHTGRTVLINSKGLLWIENEDDGTDPFKERYSDIAELIREEKLMWASLLKGKSLEHHMETSYFRAMKMTILAAR